MKKDNKCVQCHVKRARKDHYYFCSQKCAASFGRRVVEQFFQWCEAHGFYEGSPGDECPNCFRERWIAQVKKDYAEK